MTSGARPASEPEAGQAPRLCRQGHQRRAWLDAIHVPRRRSLRGCVERGSDARPAVVGFGRPALVRPRLRNTRHRRRLGHSRGVTLDDDVRVADRHRDRTPRIARDIARLQRARARLEPERAVEPQGADRGHMRAAVLVDGGEPGRAGVDRVRSRRRPRSKLRNNCGPIHRRQPVHRTQIDDLHEASLHCPGHILADGISYVRRATTAELIADVVTLLVGLGRDTVRGEWADTSASTATTPTSPCCRHRTATDASSSSSPSTPTRSRPSPPGPTRSACTPWPSRSTTSTRPSRSPRGTAATPLRGVATCEDVYKLTYVRGPSGILVMLAQEIKRS